jgi:DNA-binding response OmpR family regulator
MPGRDGFAVLKEIRRHDSIVGVLMVSALKQPQLISSALTNGADGYLNKPFRLNELLKEVQRVSALVRQRRTVMVSQMNWQQPLWHFEALAA